MKLLALDLSSHITGFAVGDASASPADVTVSTWRLRRPGQSAARAAANLGCYLRDLISVESPELIVVEDFMNPAASRNADATICALMTRGCVEGIAGAYGIAVRDVAVATVRVHFCSQATAVPARRPGSPPKTKKQQEADREETKRMVWKRAVSLGYFERGETPQFDRSDAVAVWDWGAATLCRAQRPFALFGAAP